MSEEHASIYEEVTSSIIAELEKGAAPWVKPWKGGISPSPRNAVSRRPYGGVNILLLWRASIERGYTNPSWLTVKQAQQLNASVRKGENGTRIVYMSSMKKTEGERDD